MQLSLPFSSLLAGVLFVLCVQVAESVPLAGRAPKFITLPLKRAGQAIDVHGQIYLQQHMNRGARRLARMIGTEEPSTAELHARIERRILAVEESEDLKRRTLERRFNRVGATPNPSSSVSGAVSFAEGGAQQQQKASDVTQANQPTASNSLGLDIESRDVGYSATVQLGTPARDFLVIMDSGSADFWVGSEDCNGVNGCGEHVFLGNQSSSSFQDTGKQFSVTYGSGAVAGHIVQDVATLAGLTIPSLTFGVASEETPDFTIHSSSDGLMGLARSSLSQQRTPTPVETLASAGLISEAIVSYKISRLADGLNDGEITFGALDPAKFNSQTLVTVPNVDRNGFWRANLTAATINGNDSGLSGRTAILDTGTTLMVVPPADAEKIHSAIQGAKPDGQGGFTVPCTLTDKVALQFGGQSFDIDPRDLAFVPVNRNDPSGDCISGIASGSIGGPSAATQWLVGDVFLKNVYFSTNFDKNTISLAKLT